MNRLNYAQRTNFICGSPFLNDIEFYLQSCSLPGVNVNIPEVYNQGMKALMNNDSISYTPLSLEVLIDEDFRIYEEFVKRFADRKSFTNGSFGDLYFDLYTIVYNNKGNMLFTIWYKNCRLESVSEIQLSTNDDGVVNTMSVSLVYEWFEIKHDGIDPKDRKAFNLYPKSKECECCCECD